VLSEEDRWAYLAQLDDELLVGGVLLSEWTAASCREADMAFVTGAFLGCILIAVAAIETHLRQEGTSMAHKRALAELISSSTDLTDEVREAVHLLRRNRNGWVHVDATDDSYLRAHIEEQERELEQFATSACRTMRQVLYADQDL
jgi:hypothetical protein